MPSAFTAFGMCTVPSAIAVSETFGVPAVFGCGFGAWCVPWAFAASPLGARFFVACFVAGGLAGCSAVAAGFLGGGGGCFCCAPAAPANASEPVSIPAMTHCFIFASNVNS